MPRQIVDPRPPIPAPYRTDERVAIQQMARDFAMNRVLPVANELDPEHGHVGMLGNKVVSVIAKTALQYFALLVVCCEPLATMLFATVLKRTNRGFDVSFDRNDSQ